MSRNELTPEQAWQQAIDSKESSSIAYCLMRGYRPQDKALKVRVWEPDGITIAERDLVELFFPERVVLEVANIKHAKRLLDEGFIIPAIQQSHTFESCSEYYAYLIRNEMALFIALYQQPTLINTPDEVGNTLLHYDARSSFSNTTQIIKELVDGIVDFKIQDRDGNTALHLAAIQATEDEYYSSAIFPIYVELAAKDHEFNFNLANNDGYGILHLMTSAISHCSTIERKQIETHLRNLKLQNRCDVDLFTVGSVQMTPLGFACSSVETLSYAQILISVGANMNAELNSQQGSYYVEQLLNLANASSEHADAQAAHQKILTVLRLLISNGAVITPSHRLQLSARIPNQYHELFDLAWPQQPSDPSLRQNQQAGLLFRSCLNTRRFTEALLKTLRH